MTHGERHLRQPTTRNSAFHRIHIIIHVVLGLTGIALLPVIYLSIVGVPNPVLRHIEKSLHKAGIPVRIGSVQWSFPYSLTIRNLLIYPDQNQLSGAPILDIQKMRIPNPSQFFLHSAHPPHRLYIDQAVVRVAMYNELLQYDHPANLTISNLHTDIDLYDTNITFNSLYGQCNGATIYSSGAMVLPGHNGPAGSIFDAWKSLYVTNSNPDSTWLPSLIAELNKGRYINALLTGRFYIDPYTLEANATTFHFTADQLDIRNVLLTNCLLHGHLNGSELLFKYVDAETAEGAASAYFVYNFADDIADCHATSSLPANQCFSLLPDPWKEPLLEHKVKLSGAITGSLQLGPAPITELIDVFSINAQCDQIDTPDFTFRNTLLNLDRNKKNLYFEQFQANLITDNADQGIINLSGEYDMDPHRFDFKLDTHVFPSAFSNFWAPFLTELAERFTFQSDPPHIDALLHGELGHPERYTFTGDISMTNFIYRDLPATAVRLNAMYTNNLLELTDMQLETTNGNASGNAAYTFDTADIQFQFTNTLDLRSFTRAFATNLYETLDFLTFGGPSITHMQGRVDTETQTNMQFTMDISAVDAKIDDIPISTGTVYLVGNGEEIEITNMNIRIWEGDFQGTMLTFPLHDEAGTWRYNVIIDETNMSLGAITDYLQKTNITESARSSRIDGSIKLSGLNTTNWSESLIAKGTVRIDQGCLLQIPLFGPLSRALSHIWSGLGTLHQTELNARYSIHDGLIYIDDAVLLGNIISIDIGGTISLKGELNCIVEVRFFRDGIISDLINIITMPVTKLLLQFHVTGTLSEPDWRAVPLSGTTD